MQESLTDDKESLMRRVDQLEQANAALVARNKVLEYTGSSEMQEEVKQEVKGKLNKQKQRGAIT